MRPPQPLTPPPMPSAAADPLAATRTWVLVLGGVQIAAWLCFFLAAVVLMSKHGTVWNHDDSAVRAAAHAGHTLVYLAGLYGITRAMTAVVAVAERHALRRLDSR